MLHTLVQYARDKGLDAEAGFTRKTVRWLIVFDGEGRFLDVLDLAEPNVKRSSGKTFPKVPHLKFSGDTPMRQFLVDTARYALLYEAQSPDKKLLAKHEYFLNLLKQAGEADGPFRVLADALADAETRQRICAALAAQPKPAKPADNVTFAMIEGDEPRVLVEEETWHDWWRDCFPTLFNQGAESDEPTYCLLTGELLEPARTHPKIKGLGGVGGKVETTLVGFNQDAFCSYGLKQSRNAAVGKQPAEQYAAALNHLIENHSVTLAGTKVVYWYMGKTDIKREEDPVQILLLGAAIEQPQIDVQKPQMPVLSKRAEAQALASARDLLEAGRRLRGRRGTWPWVWWGDSSAGALWCWPSYRASAAGRGMPVRRPAWNSAIHRRPASRWRNRPTRATGERGTDRRCHWGVCPPNRSPTSGVVSTGGRTTLEL